MRSLHLALIAVVAMTVGGCACKSGGSDDGGLDGGADAGPVRCAATADCAAAGLTDLVCDPQEKVCVPKCGSDNDCTYVASGVCEKFDGTCRPLCTDPNGSDYCPSVSDTLVCRAQSGRCVKKCFQDDDCSPIAKGSRCEEATGQCIAVDTAHLCQVDTDCNKFLTEFDDYCFVGGVQCRCVAEPGNDSGYAGVCHRRHRACTECTSDVECGSASYFDPAGGCKSITGDSSGKKYCLFLPSGPCACGYFPDQGNGGYCTPAQGRTCADPGCAKDSDCPGGSVCNVQRCACEPRCRWDFALKQVSAPGCPPGQTCWVDNENLDPASIYYGSGRCKSPCSNDSECTTIATNPHGGAKLKCAAEQLAGGGLSDKRCRANGECMDDLECPVQPDTSLTYGYCERGGFTCETDCRTGQDPITQKPYNDCRSPYACRQNGGTRECVLRTCVEQGGASIACNAGEYCCGEDKNGDGTADPCPPANERDPAGCYLAPKPPFCTKCESNDDCKTLQVPGWLTNDPGHCTNGSLSPSCSPFPILCYGFQNPQTMDQIGVCAPATFNDPRRDSFGRGADTKGCPATFAAYYNRVRFTDMGDDLCSSDSDCQVGTDAGRCGTDPTMTLRDGGHPKACLCTVGSSIEQCPNEDGGVFSFCKFGNNGETQACMQSVSCMPATAYVFRDAGPPFNGCGL